MSVDVVTLLKIWEECDKEPEEALISLVIPKQTGSRQVFLAWRQGRMLKEYLREPILRGVWSLYQAAHSHIMDQMSIRRRLTYIPQPGDEFRFLIRNGERA